MYVNNNKFFSTPNLTVLPIKFFRESFESLKSKGAAHVVCLYPPLL
jgi:hypothetical protein